MLSYKIGTNIYKFLADLVSKRLSRFDAVLGIYARRSLASGEIVFGKSDIDLTILIDDLGEERNEATLIHDLCKAYSRIKRLIPFMGEWNVFNEFDIRAWYALKTYEWFADKNYIKLYGKDIDLPLRKIHKDDILFKLLWWVFESLYINYKRNRTRSCFNILLELANGYYTYTGVFDEPKLKREYVLNYLIESEPECQELQILRGLFYRGFKKRSYHYLNRWIYKKCLEICDRLYDHVTKKLEGKVKYSKLFSYSPPEFLPRKYIVLSSPSDAEIYNGLDLMACEKISVLITDKLLKLYLYYFNPWEYYSISNTNGPIGISEPPSEAIKMWIMKNSNKSSARYIGLIDSKYRLFYNLIAQCQLYTDYGVISKSPEELIAAYKSYYNNWPFKENPSRFSYFKHAYPILIEIIDDIYRSLISPYLITEEKKNGSQ